MFSASAGSTQICLSHGKNENFDPIFSSEIRVKYNSCYCPLWNQVRYCEIKHDMRNRDT